MLEALQPLHDAPELVAHAAQVATVVAPVVAEYVPAAQFVHATDPDVSLYVPARHSVQDPRAVAH